MADFLSRLVRLGSFTALQEKLSKWMESYHINTCDQNVTRCCEIIELNSRIQSQLFNILALTSSEGGLYVGGAADVIRSRLLPSLSHGYLTATGLVNFGHLGLPVASTTDSQLKVDSRELNRLQDQYERSLQELETDLRATRSETDQIQFQLEETRDELNSVKRQTSNEKIFTEMEIQEIRNKLRLLEDELCLMRSRGDDIDNNFEHQIKRLKEDLTRRTNQNTYYSSPLVVDSKSLSSAAAVFSSSLQRMNLSRPGSPLPSKDSVERLRQEKLIVRYMEMYSIDRQSAMNTLYTYLEKRDECQKIIFAVMQQASTAAKLAFANYKMKVRSTLIVTRSTGSQSLEEKVQDYINRNPDAYDLPGLVSDVTRALNRRFPPDASYSVIQPFIREACKLAWNMQALSHPMDIAVASNHELFDNNRYRRNYNSDYSTPLIDHHIWPCLMQGLKVIVKGEASTKRGTTSGTEHTSSPNNSLINNNSILPVTRASRSLTRSSSPPPFKYISRRSRSPSPIKRSYDDDDDDMLFNKPLPRVSYYY